MVPQQRSTEAKLNNVTKVRLNSSVPKICGSMHRNVNLNRKKKS
jgi:hypothetical protein